MTGKKRGYEFRTLGRRQSLGGIRSPDQRPSGKTCSGTLLDKLKRISHLASFSRLLQARRFVVWGVDVGKNISNAWNRSIDRLFGLFTPFSYADFNSTSMPTTVTGIPEATTAPNNAAPEAFTSLSPLPPANEESKDEVCMMNDVQEALPFTYILTVHVVHVVPQAKLALINVVPLPVFSTPASSQASESHEVRSNPTRQCLRFTQI